VWCGSESVFRLLVILRIDDHEVGVQIFVLHCPNEVRDWIDLDTVVVADHGVGVYYVTFQIILNNLAAQTVGTIWSVAITVTDEDVVLQHRDRVRRAQSGGRLSKNR